VDRLEEGGCIERLTCPTDRLVRRAQLTDDGLRVQNEAARAHLHDLDQHFVSSLISAEMNTFMSSPASRETTNAAGPID
jgi:DNA-binding MarR family transcriptional regulator